MVKIWNYFLFFLDIVRGLINAINDEKQPVRDHIHASVRLIGLQEPILVLSKGLSFLNATSRSNTAHRVLVMNVLSRVLDEQEEHNKAFSLPDDLAKALVVMSSVEVVADKVLFFLSFYFFRALIVNGKIQLANCWLVWHDLYQMWLQSKCWTVFPPMSHHTILLSKRWRILRTNIVRIVFVLNLFAAILFLPHLKEVLTRALPILAVIKHDNLRWVFSAGLGRWAESIVVAMREKKTPVPKSEYSASIHTALKHVLGEWIASYELKVCWNTYAKQLFYRFVSLLPKVLATWHTLLKRITWHNCFPNCCPHLCNSWKRRHAQINYQ